MSIEQPKKCFYTWDDVPESWTSRCSGDGYERYIDEEGNRRYVDNNIPVGEMPFRPCARCGEFPDKDGDDFCIRKLGKVINACCGHGVREGYIQFDNDIIIEGHFTIRRFTKE